jgi:hypothetical protein
MASALHLVIGALMPAVKPAVDVQAALNGTTAEINGVNAEAGLLESRLIDADSAIFGFANQQAYAATQSESWRKSLQQVQQQGASLGDFLSHDLGPIILSAFTGGGDVAKSIGAGIGGFLTSTTSSIGKKLATSLASTLGDTIGGAVSSILPGLGSVLGGLVGKLFGKIFSIGGPSEAEVAGRDLEAAFEKGFGGFDAMMSKIGKAYDAMGLSSTQAQADVKALLDAEKQGPAATQAWIDKINAIVAAAAKLADQGKSAATQFGEAFKIPADALKSYDQLNAKQMDLSAQIAKSSGSSRDALVAQYNDVMSQMNQSSALWRATAPKTAADANAMATAVVADFASMIKNGVNFTDAVKAIQPAVTNLDAIFGGMGDTVANTGDLGGAAFKEIKSFVDLASDAIAGPALTSVSNLIGGMKTLDQMGLGNKETFGGLANQIGTTFDELVAQGKDGSVVMMAMRDQIQTVWEEQQKYGFTVDDSTQKVIDMAKQQGLVGPQMKSVNDQLLDVMKDIRDVLAQMIGNTQGFVGALRSIPTNIQATVTTVHDDIYNRIDNGSSDVPQFASGAIVNRPTVALIGERGPEMVVPLPGSAGYQRLQPNGANPYAGGGGDLMVIKVGSDASPDDVWSALPDRIKRNYKGLRTQLIQAIS